MSTDGFIHVRDLDLAYMKEGKSFQVIKGLNLGIRKGEFAVLVGPSDSGKTCLLRLIGGFENPTGGEILVDGRPVTGPDPSRGYVFQFHASMMGRAMMVAPINSSTRPVRLNEYHAQYSDREGLARTEVSGHQEHFERFNNGSNRMVRPESSTKGAECCERRNDGSSWTWRDYCCARSLGCSWASLRFSCLRILQHKVRAV